MSYSIHTLLHCCRARGAAALAEERGSWVTSEGIEALDLTLPTAR